MISGQKCYDRGAGLCIALDVAATVCRYSGEKMGGGGEAWSLSPREAVLVERCTVIK